MARGDGATTQSVFAEVAAMFADKCLVAGCATAI
jgi:hypothetical protein